ncbi:p21-C-terminal region-binding protein-domain-containing protein [Blastocladiella britannica]|nr:p21-C-terminal region-binding protein-domain-containing protein [Blastocladiella britannica]
MALGPDAGDQLQGLVDLTDVVLSQKFGTGVKCDGEESDPYAITSLVGLTGPQWGTNTTTAPLRDLLRTRSSSSVEADAQRLEKLLSETATGRTALLLHERLINMPWQVSAPLFRLLLDEVAATKTKVDTVVLLCPMFRPDGDDGDGAEEDDGDQGEDAPPAQKRAKAAIIRDQLLGKKAKKAKKKTVAKRAEALAAHAYLELEYLEKIAEYTFHFKHASSGSETDNMTALQGVKGSRRGLVVKWSKLAAVVAELESLVQESEALITQERVDHDDDDDE